MQKFIGGTNQNGRLIFECLSVVTLYFIFYYNGLNYRAENIERSL